jgi:hypothetical protein
MAAREYIDGVLALPALTAISASSTVRGDALRSWQNGEACRVRILSYGDEWDSARG